MIRHGNTQRIAVGISFLAGLLLLVGPGFGKHKEKDVEPPFQYLAGTEDVARGCAGRLEVLKDSFSFTCPGATISVPYAGVTLMQYRPDVSAQVMGMDIPWKIKPQLARVRDNKYFTIVCKDQGKVRVVVFRVAENDMRPYFAEIELRSGKSVQEYRSFEEFN